MELKFQLSRLNRLRKTRGLFGGGAYGSSIDDPPWWQDEQGRAG